LKRLSFCESWDYLKQTTSFLDANAPCPKRVSRATRWGGGCGIEFIKSEFYDESDPEGLFTLENLTLPGLFICRSYVYYVSFRNTSLVGSFFCWNDFIDVDFTDADLSECDLRCSLYRNVSFTRADLRGADLRSCTFENCNFTEANMTGAKLLRSESKGLPLSEQQSQEIAWKRSYGRLPND
jgi:BTB/POZ domain-containing protein KCTD9